MRVKSLVLVMIALVCGLLATIGISQVIDKNSKAGAAQETVKIFVSIADIDIGNALTSENVKLEPWPKDRVPEGAITRLDELENRFARQRLYAGEPILAAKLMDSNSDTTMTIPEGFRACSIKVSGEVVVGNLVKPGDRVDVIVFLRKSGDVPLTGTRTILRDVRVFAVNSKTERSVDEQGQVTTAQTVTLLVNPKQVELLTLASELGNLRLCLRRPNDAQSIASDDGTTVESFLEMRSDAGSGRSPSGAIASLGFPSPGSLDPEAVPSPTTAGTEAESSEGSSSGGLLDLLNSMRNKLPVPGGTPLADTNPIPVQPGPAPPPPPPPPPVLFSMTVHTPQGLVRYDWTDEKEMPQMVSLQGDVPANPAWSAPETTPPAEAQPVKRGTLPTDEEAGATPN